MECYKIKRLLGRGVCGKAYLVEEKATQKTYVLNRVDVTHLSTKECEAEVLVFL